jgi:hypothetical protein
VTGTDLARGRADRSIERFTRARGDEHRAAGAGARVLDVSEWRGDDPVAAPIRPCCAAGSARWMCDVWIAARPAIPITHRPQPMRPARVALIRGS